MYTCVLFVLVLFTLAAFYKAAQDPASSAAMLGGLGFGGALVTICFSYLMHSRRWEYALVLVSFLVAVVGVVFIGKHKRSNATGKRVIFTRVLTGGAFVAFCTGILLVTFT